MQKTGWTIHSFFLVLSGLKKSFTLDVTTRGQLTTIFLCIGPFSVWWQTNERTNNRVILVQACPWSVWDGSLLQYNQHLTRMAPRSSKEFAEIAKSSYNFMLVNTTIEMPQIGFLFEFQLNLSFFRSDTLSHVLCPPSGTVLKVAEWRYVPLFPHLKTWFYNLVVLESKIFIPKVFFKF